MKIREAAKSAKFGIRREIPEILLFYMKTTVNSNYFAYENGLFILKWKFHQKIYNRLV